MQDLLGDAAHKKPPHLSAPMATHYDEIGVPGIGYLNDLRRGIAGFDEFANARADGCSLPKGRDEMSRCLFRHLGQPVGWHAPRGARADGRVKNVDEANFGLQ